MAATHVLQILLPDQPTSVIVQAPSSVTTVAHLLPWLHAKFQLSDGLHSYSVLLEHAVLDGDLSLSPFHGGMVLLRVVAVPHVGTVAQHLLQRPIIVPDAGVTDDGGSDEVDTEQLGNDTAAAHGHLRVPAASKLTAAARKKRNMRNRIRLKQRKLQQRMSDACNAGGTAEKNEELKKEKKNDDSDNKGNNTTGHTVDTPNSHTHSQLQLFLSMIQAKLKLPSDQIILPRLALARHASVLESIVGADGKSNAVTGKRRLSTDGNEAASPSQKKKSKNAMQTSASQSQSSESESESESGSASSDGVKKKGAPKNDDADEGKCEEEGAVNKAMDVDADESMADMLQLVQRGFGRQEPHKNSEAKKNSNKKKKKKQEGGTRQRGRRMGSLSAALETARRSGALGGSGQAEDREKVASGEEPGEEVIEELIEEEVEEEVEVYTPPRRKVYEVSLQEAVDEEQYNTSVILAAGNAE